MNFDSSKNNQQNSVSSDDSPLDFLSQSDVLQTRDKFSDFSENREEPVIKSSDPVSKLFKEDSPDKDISQKKDSVLDEQDNKDYVVKPVEVAKANLDKTNKVSSLSERQVRIDELKEKIEKVKETDQVDKASSKIKDKVSFNKFLLFTGPAFLIVCILISYLILNSKLLEEGEVFSKFIYK